MTPCRERLRPIWDASSAFFRAGFIDSVTYPLGFALSQLTAILPIFLYFFIAKLVRASPAYTGGDYFAFVALGLVVLRVLSGALEDYSVAMQQAIDHGQLELFLMEPVGWRVLPFVMAQWPLVQRLVTGALALLASLALGATYRVSGATWAVAILILGVGASHVVGIFAASLRVLAKRADPILALYGMATVVMTGAVFPVRLLPPWIRPLAWLVPHTYVVSLVRRVLMPAGNSLGGPSLSLGLLALAAFDIFGYILALWVFEKSIDFGRRAGVLSAY